MSEIPNLDWLPLAECSRAWEVSRTSIIWAYWTKRIYMVKAGNTWLVYWPAMVLHFGNPHLEIRLEADNSIQS